MKHYFLIPSVSSQKLNCNNPPLKTFNKEFPHKFRAELHNFYNKSLIAKNRHSYRFIDYRGIEQKFWVNQ